MNTNVKEANINEYGRFDDLKKTVVREKAAEYFVSTEGEKVPEFRLSIKIEQLLKDFILNGGFEINDDKEE